MHVDRVRPSEAAVEVPLFERILGHFEADRVAVEQLSIDRPLSVARLIEVERAGYHRRPADTKKRVIAWQRSCIAAIVGDRRSVDDDLQHQEAWSTCYNAAG